MSDIEVTGSMADPGKKKTFIVVFEVEAKAVGKMRNEVRGQMTSPVNDAVFEFATDEGSAHGGEETAPPPLAYFCTGLVTCLMTQVRAFAKRMRVPVGEMTVKARIEWEATVEGRDPYTSRAVSFALDINLDSDAPFEDQKRLLDAAQKGCFVEATLADPIPVNHKLLIDGEYRDAD
jgi:uncharacterized OsmC-like protein